MKIFRQTSAIFTWICNIILISYEWTLEAMSINNKKTPVQEQAYLEKPVSA